jgi:hypothetical protein
MILRLLVLAACVALCGCADDPHAASEPPPGAKAAKLPPEVEFDPATAAEQYKAAQKKPRK